MTVSLPNVPGESLVNEPGDVQDDIRTPVTSVDPVELEPVELEPVELGNVDLMPPQSTQPAAPIPPYGPLNMVFESASPTTIPSEAAHLPDLPAPAPITAEQFMPVLAPQTLSAYLGEVRRDLMQLGDEATRAELTRRSRGLELRLTQYEVNYGVTQAALTRALAETGVGVRDSWSRQDEYLRFMNDSSSASERAYRQATEAIEQATQQRFDALIKQGHSPHLPDADAVYMNSALASLAAEGTPYRPEPRKTFSGWAFNFFAVASKFFVGLLSGVSINLLFNPDSRLYLTVIALSAGVMFSVLLLWLLEELAYRTRLSPVGSGGSKRVVIGRVLAMLAVSVLYLSVEGYLNWDGILRVTQQLAANAAQSSTLQDLSAPDSGVPVTPQHWSLLAFTVALVGMAVGAALVQGRNRAFEQLEAERLSGRVAQLRSSGALQEVARAADLPAWLEEARERIRPPRDISSPRHAKLNERVLGWWEQERDSQISELSGAIVREAKEVQALLESLALDVQRARFPVRRRLGGLLS